MEGHRGGEKVEGWSEQGSRKERMEEEIYEETKWKDVERSGKDGYPKVEGKMRLRKWNEGETGKEYEV